MRGQSEHMRRWILAAILLVMVAVGFLLSVNGLQAHPYTNAQLEDSFLTQARQNGLVVEDDYTLLTKEHGNSTIYLIEDNVGKHAWAIYVMTPITGKYKLEIFDTDVENTENTESASPMTYHINDGLLAYDITIDYAEEMDIVGGTTQNVVTTKLFTMSFAIVIIMAVTLFSYARDKERNKFS